MYDETYFRNLEVRPGVMRPDFPAEQDRLIRKSDERLIELERLRRPGRLLEIGCATGFLLEAARRRGWKVTGTDISAFAAKYAEKEFGVEVRVGTIPGLDMPKGSFDAVMALEYIEHVPDPVETLRAVRQWIREDGVLMMSTPNAGSWTARRHPDRFDGYLERRHLVYFTRSTMKLLLERSGFSLLDIRTDNALVTTDTLSAVGIRSPDRWRTLANRLAPGLKTWIRRAVGRAFGGPCMVVFATPKGSKS